MPEIEHLLTAETIAAMPESVHRHRLNPKGVRNGKSLGDALGMQQLGVHLVRIAPGEETTEFHFHRHDEEWLYILAGRGLAEIGERKVEVKAGDFMGFTAPSLPHAMSNPFAEDLVYLMGGTRHAWDVVEYPRRGVRSYKYPGTRDNVEAAKVWK